MSFETLKQEVWRANHALASSGLVLFTWGNVSGVAREAEVMAIKPSGVAYDELSPEDIVALSLVEGEVVEGELRPSSDTPTHRLLYQHFDTIGGIVHTHSTYATSWAQANREIPCFGTTHADHAYGPVPITRQFTTEEIQSNYERNTGALIVERFMDGELSPSEIPGVLVPNHGVFAWGSDPMHALENAIVIEEVAKMGLFTIQINPQAKALSQTLLDKHFLRKHGAGAYYGQGT